MRLYTSLAKEAQRRSNFRRQAGESWQAWLPQRTVQSLALSFKKKPNFHHSPKFRAYWADVLKPGTSHTNSTATAMTCLGSRLTWAKSGPPQNSNQMHRAQSVPLAMFYVNRAKMAKYVCIMLPCATLQPKGGNGGVGQQFGNRKPRDATRCVSKGTP